MKIVKFLIENYSKQERQLHINLNENCIERGGNSTNHKGVLAQFLDTDIPYGYKYMCCHACNNGKCSNPKHLYWGTSKENVEDSIIFGSKYSPIGVKLGPMNEVHKKRISLALTGKPSNFKNRKHSIESKMKMRKRKLGNSSVGRTQDFES